MKLYDAPWAPSPRRVRMYLAEKGIEIERVQLDLRKGDNLRPDYVSVNPQRQLPALQLDDGSVIDDSLGICRYFEALQPDPPLFGATPLEAGLVEAWIRRVEHDWFQAVALYFRNQHAVFADRAVGGEWPPIPQIPALVDRGLCMWNAFADVLDRHLAGRSNMVGDGFTMADIVAFVAADFGISATLPDPREGRESLAGWHAAIAARPSAAA
jgi:glutathione S-transferase